MKRIAVVEDNPDNRLLVRVILESLYEVTEYDTGFAALEGLPKQIPDLVLLDISLPELDGAEVLRRIRADPGLQHLPVIALTAHAMAGDREKYLAGGFNDYVAKPIVDEQLLLDAIQRRLSEAPKAGAPEACTKRPLDEAALDRLRRLGGEPFVKEMINLFLEYVQAQISEAQRAHLAGDMARVGKAVHPIKSSAGNVGATLVQALAARLEEAASGQQAADVNRLLGELDAAFAAVKPTLESAKKDL